MSADFASPIARLLFLRGYAQDAAKHAREVGRRRESQRFIHIANQLGRALAEFRDMEGVDFVVARQNAAFAALEERPR